MASSSGGGVTAVHFSLIFFVMLSIILGVVTYLKMQEVGEFRAKAKKADDEKRQADTDRNNLLDEVKTLKTTIGYSDAVGLDDDSQNNIPGRVNSLLTSLGPNQQGRPQILGQKPTNLVDAITKLQSELVAERSMKQTAEVTRADEAQMHMAVEEVSQALVVIHETKVSTAETQLTQVQKNSQEKLAEKDAQITTQNSTIARQKRDYTDLDDLYTKTKKELEDKLARLAEANKNLKRLLDEIQQVSFEVPDGKIVYVDHVAKLVWLDLGSADNLRERTTFSVYRRAHSGMARGAEDIKGAIEVVRIIGPGQAEARILENDIYDPIGVGDPIYTPVWSPGRTETFSLVGLIDFDDDGKSDRDRLHALIKAAGGSIDNEVDDNGTRTGTGVTYKTKFLVEGIIPDPTKVGPRDQEAARKIQTELKKIRDDARDNNVRRVRLQDFLNYIGYKNTRRLWQPGSPYPYKLKAGAQSAGINQTLDDRTRAASGRTSGVYSRSKRLKQQTSSGQTSKAFRGGKGGY